MKQFLLYLFFPEVSFRKNIEERKVSKGKIIYCVCINAFVPFVFLLLGLFIYIRPALKEDIQTRITTSIPEDVDNYARYLPIPFIYGLQFAGIKPASSIVKRTGVIALTYIVSDLIVHRTKKATKSVRPNGEENSFPSQHTNQSFLAASILHHEYVGSSTAVSAVGYACAASVAVLRVARDRHWSSDVLVGAAVGMFTTNLVYLFMYSLLYRMVRTIWEKSKRLFHR